MRTTAVMIGAKMYNAHKPDIDIGFIDNAIPRRKKRSLSPFAMGWILCEVKTVIALIIAWIIWG
jgi:hypothetical protein